MTQSIQDTILLIGPLVILPLSLVSLIGLIIMIIIEKKVRPFLVLIFFISLTLSGYIISNFLLGIFGFNTGDSIRIQQNKETIILLSKLEILLLTIGLILLSSISLVLLDNTISKIKFFILLISGLVIMYLTFFSEKFFLKDTLKLSINKYMAQEGPLFSLFIVYFAIVVISEFLMLITLARKINTKFDYIYKPTIYGISVIIFFGILELLELYDIINIYPYLPSLLGTGISLFSIVVMSLVVNRHLVAMKYNKLSIRMIEETKKNLETSNKEVIDEINNLLNLITSTEKEIKNIQELPKITQAIIDEINKSFSSINNIIKRNAETTNEILKQISSYTETIKIKDIKDDLSNKYQKILNFSKKANILKGSSKKLEEYLKNKDNFKSNLSLDFTYTISFPEEINRYFIDTKVMLINISILGSKIKSSSNFSNILSEEMLKILDEVIISTQSLTTLTNNLNELNSKLNNLQEKLNQEIDSFQISYNVSQEEEEIHLLFSNILKEISEVSHKLSNLSNIKDKIFSMITSENSDIQETVENMRNLYGFIKETQLMYENYSNLIQNIEKLHESISFIKKYIDELRSKLS
ncbi:MAG: hypothetical protein N2712_00535 [Brevinematales bacterium]|nr:hypothetical protein [Brevinematales bacterium]